MPRKSRATIASRRRSPANLSEPSRDGETSFIFFNKLPVEIRIVIWQDALPGPRIVHVKMGLLASTNFGRRRVRSDRTVLATDRETSPGNEGYDDYLRKRSEMELISAAEDGKGWDTDDEESGDWRKPLCGFRTRCPTPAMLLACRESHNVASKVYVRAFGTEAALPSIWFDFTQDILYFNQETIEDSGGSEPATWMPDAINRECSKQDLARVQNLAIRCDDMHAMDYELWLIPTFATFENLKKFTVVLQHFEPPLHPELKQQFEPKEQASLAFADLVALDKPRGAYQSEHYHQMQESGLHGILPPLYKFHFGAQQLTQYREEWIEMGFNKWELPDIDQKVVTSHLYQEDRGSEVDAPQNGLL